LQTVKIGKKVESIGEKAFFSCPSLESFVVDPENLHFQSDNGVLYNKGQTTLIQCPSKKVSVTIPDSVTIIGSNAFYGCKSLEIETIGKGVQTIKSFAFYDCSALTSIILSENINYIGDNAFYLCTNLNKVNFTGNQDPQHGNDVFGQDNKLSTISVSSQYQGNTFCGKEVGKPQSPTPSGSSPGSSSDSSSDSSSGLSTGAIIGIAIAGLVFIAAVVVVVFLIMKRKNKAESHSDEITTV